MTSAVMEMVKDKGGRPSTKFAPIQQLFLETLYCDNDYTNPEVEFFGGVTKKIFNYENGLNLRGRFGERSRGGKKAD